MGGVAMGVGRGCPYVVSVPVSYGCDGLIRSLNDRMFY
jgi:hypothetical protein